MPCIPSAHDITSLYSMDIATIDTHRTIKKKNMSSSYSKQIHKAAPRVRLLNVDRTSDHLMTKGCGQIDTVPSRKFTKSTIVSVINIAEFRSQETKLKLLTQKQGYVSEWLRSKLYLGIINALLTTPPIASELQVLRSPVAFLTIDQVYRALTQGLRVG